MKLVFTNWSLTTPAENIQEIYINHTTEYKAFRVIILDDNKVNLTFFSNSAKVFKFNVGEKTIYEGEPNDVNYPHFYPNRNN